MRIVITTRKPVLTDLGRLPQGIPVDVPPLLGKHLLESGAAVLYETKVAMDRPIVAAGVVAPSSASPVAPASPQTTQIESANGARKRGRPRKEASLS